MKPSRPTPSLPVGRYRVSFQTADGSIAAPWSGSAWRGTLGHALRTSACITRERHCPRCLLYRSCLYPYVFETPPPEDSEKMRRYTAAPHPFVLEPLMRVPPSPATAVGLTLIGRGCQHLGYFIHALGLAGQRGIGPARTRLQVDSVHQEAGCGTGRWEPVYEARTELRAATVVPSASPPMPTGTVVLRLHTPLRLKRDGRNVTPEGLQFGDLFSNLLRRVSMLTYFHTDAPLETDFAGLVREAREVQLVDRDLHWREWSRYSSRQNTRMEMGGIVGETTIDTSGCEAFWPYLWLGQWLHAGKGTSMGLGQYTIESAKSGYPAA